MKKQDVNISRIILFTQIFGVIIMGFYVFHINTISTEGYTLKKLQEERDILLSKQEDLNLKISRVQSLNTLKNDVSIKMMISYQETPVYIKTNKKVALRK